MQRRRQREVCLWYCFIGIGGIAKVKEEALLCCASNGYWRRRAMKDREESYVSLKFVEMMLAANWTFGEWFP